MGSLDLLVLVVALELASREDVLSRRGLPVYSARSCLTRITRSAHEWSVASCRPVLWRRRRTFLRCFFPCDKAGGSVRVFAVSPGGAGLWLVFLAHQLVEANLQKDVGPLQLHLNLGVSKQMMVWLAATKKYIYSTSLFSAPLFKIFKGIFLMLKLSHLVPREVCGLSGLCRVEEWRFPDLSANVIWPPEWPPNLFTLQNNYDVLIKTWAKLHFSTRCNSESRLIEFSWRY